MRGMATAVEYPVPPPKGTYRCVIAAATPQLSKSGSPQIKLVTEVAEGPEKGAQFFDYLMTDGTAKGAGMSKTRLRGLGVNVDSDAEVADETIAAQLTGRFIFVTIDHEAQTTKASGYTEPATVVDPKTGQVVTLMKARIVSYSQANVGAAPQQGMPQQFAGAPAPQQFAGASPAGAPAWAAPQQQGAPQQGMPQQGAPQQFAPQAAPQYAPQQFAPQPQPQQFAQQGAPGMPGAPLQMPQAWGGQPQQPTPAYGFSPPPFPNGGQK